MDLIVSEKEHYKICKNFVVNFDHLVPIILIEVKIAIGIETILRIIF